MFARGTKGEDAAPSMPRGSTGSAYDGFGALMDAYSDDSDDDSDAEGRPQRTHETQAPSSARMAPPTASDGGRPHTRESWSARAQAVGQRPPDSASQNPPTLKLLGLKSQKEGGAPIGGPQSPAGAEYAAQPQGSTLRSNPPQRHDVHEQSMSEYGDNSSRIGSTIDFAGQHGHHAGHGSDGFGGHGGDTGFDRHGGASAQVPSHLRPPPQAATKSAPHDPRSALTAQLGLDTPQPDRQPSPTGYGQPPSDYFNRNGPPQGNAHEVPLERNTSNESSNFGGGPRTPDHAVVRPYPPQGQASSYPGGPGSSPPGNPFSDRAAPSGRPLVNAPNGRPVGGPSAPMGRGPPGFQAPPGPQGGQGFYNGQPYGGGAPRPGQGPGFSDAQRRPQDQRRQSIFRRSMAFMTGNGGSGPQDGGAPQPRPTREGGNRQSIFRRSMAFLSGSKPAPPAPAPESDDANCPAPRVRGFNEKEADNRKSQYWGGGGEGREWDTDGVGSKFWRRFSAAQKHAETPGDKMEMASRSTREKVMAQKKAATWLAGLGGILIIAAVVAVVIWRESKSSSTDDHPGSINKGNYGGTDTRQRRAPMQTSLPGAEMERYQRLANEAMWARAKVESPADDDGAVERAASPTQAAATPAAEQARQSMRRRVRRHSMLHRSLEAAEQESA